MKFLYLILFFWNCSVTIEKSPMQFFPILTALLSSENTTQSNTPSTTPTQTPTSSSTPASSPVLSPTLSRMNSGSTITISSTNSGAIFCYTTNGTAPSCASSGTSCEAGNQGSTITYTPVLMQVKVRACVSGSLPSEEVSKYYYSPLIYITSQTFNGNFSDSTGDSTCNSDANKPSNSTKPYIASYKMMRVGGGRTVTNDWVLYPNQEYYNLSNQLIYTSDSNSLLFPGAYSNPISASASFHWFGSANGATWTVGPNSCTGWTSSSNAVQGGRGQNNSTTPGALVNNAAANCDQFHNIMCAEQ
ncbi:MAG: DUF1554 domain-containing protein [Leptospiraceae bacterium]|nr:DUF1554 domain-containing protein [Leptospiraceae bacterium]